MSDRSAARLLDAVRQDRILIHKTANAGKTEMVMQQLRPVSPRPPMQHQAVWVPPIIVVR